MCPGDFTVSAAIFISWAQKEETLRHYRPPQKVLLLCRCPFSRMRSVGERIVSKDLFAPSWTSDPLYSQGYYLLARLATNRAETHSTETTSAFLFSSASFPEGWQNVQCKGIFCLKSWSFCREFLSLFYIFPYFNKLPKRKTPFVHMYNTTRNSEMNSAPAVVFFWYKTRVPLYLQKVLLLLLNSVAFFL